MVNFKRLTDRAKDAVEKRGGKDALKDDMQELRNIAKGKGSLKEKATAAKDALKDPGREGSRATSPSAGSGESPTPTPATPPPTEPTAATPSETSPPETGAAPTGPDPTAADTPESPRTK